MCIRDRGIGGAILGFLLSGFGYVSGICLLYTSLRKKASTNQEVIVEELPDVIDWDEDDFEQIPQSVLMQFIKELPDWYRTVFNLYVLEEKGHKEIAEMLGITEHTSSSQLYLSLIHI